MKLTKIRGSGCPDGNTCPAKHTTDRDTFVIVGQEVTDPEALAQLAGKIGPGETAVEIPRETSPEPALLDATALGELLSGAQRELFRLECMDAYDVASDGGDYGRYVRGEPGPDPVRKGAWLQRLREDRARGLRRRRVHVLRSPIGDYLRYSCEWGYALNAQAGEDIRILDLAERPCPEFLIRDEFWLVDSQTVVLMHYDARGRFLGASVLAPAAATHYRAARDAAWSAAEPFGSWWAAHPEYHRDGRRAA